MSQLLVRDVCPQDVDALLAIHNHYIRHTAVNFDWEEVSRGVFCARMERTLTRYPYFVAERGGVPVGFSYAGPFVGRSAYDWSAELTIYLAPDERGQGTGRKLYDSLEAALSAMGIRNLYACIGYPEEEDEYLTQDSARFHEHMGFAIVGRHHKCGYKFGRWYDMVWMEKIIRSHDEGVDAVIAYRDIAR